MYIMTTIATKASTHSWMNGKQMKTSGCVIPPWKSLYWETSTSITHQHLGGHAQQPPHKPQQASKPSIGSHSKHAARNGPTTRHTHTGIMQHWKLDLTRQHMEKCWLPLTLHFLQCQPHHLTCIYQPPPNCICHWSHLHPEQTHWKIQLQECQLEDIQGNPGEQPDRDGNPTHQPNWKIVHNQDCYQPSIQVHQQNNKTSGSIDQNHTSHEMLGTKELMLLCKSRNRANTEHYRWHSLPDHPSHLHYKEASR